MLDISPLSHAVVSHRCKAVYFPIPKAGCSSIKSLLRKAEGLPPTDPDGLHDRERSGLMFPHMIDLQDFHRLLHSPRDDRERGHYFRFTVCRNPYARLASAYLDKVAGKEDGLGDQGRSIDLLRMALYRGTGRMPGSLSFEDFVDAIALSRVRDLNRHWQHQIVLACASFVTLDWRLKLEEMPEKMPRLLRTLLLSPTTAIEKMNATGSQLHLAELYTPALIEKVRTLYARDFVHFRYDDSAAAIGRQGAGRRRRRVTTVLRRRVTGRRRAAGKVQGACRATASVPARVSRQRASPSERSIASPAATRAAGRSGVQASSPGPARACRLRRLEYRIRHLSPKYRQPKSSIMLIAGPEKGGSGHGQIVGSP